VRPTGCMTGLLAIEATNSLMAPPLTVTQLGPARRNYHGVRCHLEQRLSCYVTVTASLNI